MVLKFIDGHEICTKPELENDGKVIFGNDSCEYVCNQSGSNSHIQSDYYRDYSQLIRRNQSHPVLSDRFEKVVTDEVS